MDKTNELAGELLGIVKSMEEFSIDHAPDVVAEIIRFSTLEHIFTFLAGIVCVVVGWRVFKVGRGLEADYEEIDDGVVPQAVGLVGSLTGVILSLCGAAGLIKIWVAPKLFILDYIADKLG